MTTYWEARFKITQIAISEIAVALGLPAETSLVIMIGTLDHPQTVQLQEAREVAIKRLDEPGALDAHCPECEKNPERPTTRADYLRWIEENCLLSLVVMAAQNASFARRLSISATMMRWHNDRRELSVPPGETIQ